MRDEPGNREPEHRAPGNRERDPRTDSSSTCSLAEDDSTADLPAGVIGRVRGQAGEADTVNQNRHRYPLSVYRRAVRQFNLRGKSGHENDELLGQLDHGWHPHGQLQDTALRVTRLYLAAIHPSNPPTIHPSNPPTIHPSNPPTIHPSNPPTIAASARPRASHLFFEADLLDTPPGRTLKALLSAGVRVNVSTRGTGSLKPCCQDHTDEHGWLRTRGTGFPDHDPCLVVGEDYSLHGIDAVTRGADRSAAFQACEAKEIAMEQERGNEIREDSGAAEIAHELAAARTQIDQGRAQIDRDLGELDQARAEMAALQAAARQRQQEMARQIEEARGERDALRAQFEQLSADANRHAVSENIRCVVQGLAPEVRATVEQQLAGCGSPSEVQERWSGIEVVLASAGLTRSEPAGAGKVDPGDQPHLSPEQRLQRALLGIS